VNVAHTSGEIGRKPLSKRAAQLLRAMLAALALCAWHDSAAARTKTPKRESQQPPTILCLRPADMQLARQKENDRKVLDCLLQTADGAEVDQWPSQLRGCLSTSGVIRIPNCHY
jgi:hypothetical protein